MPFPHFPVLSATVPLCPQYPAAQGQVIVFMRYKAEMDRRIRNALVRMSGRIKQYGPGHVVGIANKVGPQSRQNYSNKRKL